MPVDKVTIKIPRTLYDKILKVTEDSGFNSPTDFIVYVLRDLLGDLQTSRPHQELSEEEINAIRHRLKSLGYL